MKKTNQILLAILILLCGIIFGISPTNAAGPGQTKVNARLSVSASTTQVNGSITGTVNTFLYRCTNPSTGHTWIRQEPDCATFTVGYVNDGEAADAGKTLNISVSGSGNTISPASVVTDGAGNAQFSLSSSVSEAKTINIYWSADPSQAVATASVNFTSPPPAPATTSAPSTTARTSTTQVEPAPPTAPSATAVADGVTIKPDKKTTIRNDETLVLSGKTVPNGVITLYVFSQPKKYTVTADKEGNWLHKLSGLAAGEHHIEAEVTDPATGKTSSRAQIMAFTVKKAAKQLASTPAQHALSEKKNFLSNPLILAGVIGGGIVFVFALTAAYMWKFKRGAFDSLLQRLHIKPPTPPVN